MKTVEMNICGQVCPSCLLLALREVNLRHAELMSREVKIMVRTDSRDATGTIPTAVQNMGFTAAVQKEQGVYVIAIQRGDEGGEQ